MKVEMTQIQKLVSILRQIFQGLLRSHKDYQYSRQTFLRLWVHESFRVFCDRLIDEK